MSVFYCAAAFGRAFKPYNPNTNLDTPFEHPFYRLLQASRDRFQTFKAKMYLFACDSKMGLLDNY